MAREPHEVTGASADSPSSIERVAVQGALADDEAGQTAARRREPLSVVVTTLDNAATLDRCLAGVTWADEIVVLDSGSRDATLDIARSHGARIFSEPFKGYAAQKQSAIDKAAHDWVLLLDADESLGANARAVIERALDHPTVAGYRRPRQIGRAHV